MNSEKLHLKWNDYEANIRSIFQELKEDTDHVDVTLSCHDGQIHAHKVILSACSSIDSRVFLCDCETSNFAKIRFHLCMTHS